MLKIIMAALILTTSIPSAQATTRALIETGLRDNIVALPAGQVVTAGPYQFRSVWARDFAFAVPGLLKIGLQEPVRDTLRLFFNNARPSDGLLPRILDSHSFKQRVVLGVARIQMPLGPELEPAFETENGVISMDGNLLLISAAWSYIRATGDWAFAAELHPRALASLEWIRKHHLSADAAIVNQPPYADWADSVARQGSVGLTQVLLVRALDDMAAWNSMMGIAGGGPHARLAEAAKRALHERFRAPEGYVVNSLGDGRLSAEANWAAVAWGVVDEAFAREILRALEARPHLVSPLPGRVLDGEYAPSEKSIFAKAVGLHGYHDRFTWLWITALAIQAYDRVGDNARANEIRRGLLDLVEKHGGVHEIYNLKRGELVPVRTWAYPAEFPFTWSSAMILDAL